MLTVQQCAERLNCHDGLVRRLISAGKLLGSKIGKEWRVKPEDLEAFLAGARPVTAEPVIPLAERLPEPSRRRFM